MRNCRTAIDGVYSRDERYRQEVEKIADYARQHITHSGVKRIAKRPRESHALLAGPPDSGKSAVAEGLIRAYSRAVEYCGCFNPANRDEIADVRGYLKDRDGKALVVEEAGKRKEGRGRLATFDLIKQSLETIDEFTEAGGVLFVFVGQEFRLEDWNESPYAELYRRCKVQSFLPLLVNRLEDVPVILAVELCAALSQFGREPRSFKVEWPIFASAIVDVQMNRAKIVDLRQTAHRIIEEALEDRAIGGNIDKVEYLPPGKEPDPPGDVNAIIVVPDA